ncbi:KA1 domain/Ssp2 C-terminal domain-containing protein [Blastocladiella britannica]|nr:KA1 domain/Ssp2 C-terminal domain-containing protein [Blastocladiella britannica]
MPLPQVSDKSRRASTPDAEPQPLPTVRVPERPRHSTTSLATSGPRSAPGVAASALALNTQGPPSPGSTPGPQSAGTQIMHRPATSAAGTVVDKQTLAVGTTGPQAGDKGRRFSLAVLTSGSKRRSSTSPPTAPVAGTVPVHLPSVLPMVQDPSNSDEGSSGSTSPSGTLTVAEVHSSASASSSESSNADARTVSSWFLNVNTTSSKPPAEIIAEVKRVLTECHVQYAHDAGFVVECRLADLVFEIEICKVPRLALFGLHFKRISGGIWTYKKLCNKLLSQMSL